MDGVREIGFLTVVAVSGCLIFLVLDRQRLRELKVPQNCSAKKRERAADYQPRCRRSCLSSSAKKFTNAEKKVRFAEDVVEFSADNEKYRRRRVLATTKQLRPRACAAVENTEVCSSNPGQPAGTANSGWKSGEIDADDASTGVNGERQTLAKPNIPANRLALYKGILRCRSQRIFFQQLTDFD